MLSFGRAAAHAGFTLIEVMITIAVVAIVLTLGLPSYRTWIQNTQIRTAAESALAGLQLARAEALKRNTNVRFQLMTSMTASCATSATATNWIVSVKDATSLCHITNPATDPPLLIQAKPSGEGTKNVTFAMADTTGTSQPVITFSALGQVTPPLANAPIILDIENPTAGGACVASGGKMRCLQIRVESSGQIRMCDPAVTATDDPRIC